MRRIFAQTLLALTISFSLTQQARAYDSNALASATEMARYFHLFCLDKFPDREAMGALAKDMQFKVMNYGELKRYQPDLGLGWYFSADSSLYVVTIEDSPNDACEVRHMTPEGIPSADAYSDVVRNYAATKKGQLFKSVTSEQKTPDGSDVHVYGNIMKDSSGRQSDIFLLVFTDYHGKVPDEWKSDAQNNKGVEIRMEHRLMVPQQRP